MSVTRYPDGVRQGALVPVLVPSIYLNYTASLPSRMAWLTPDTAQGLDDLVSAVSYAGGKLYLSDAFRSEQAQACARYDYLTGIGRLDLREELVAKYTYLKDYVACNNGLGKRAFSPPPGYSVHEAGRAIDVDLDVARLGIDQTQFAQIAYSIGWNNIVGGINGMGDPNRVDVKEEWHWEFRGAFQARYNEVLEQTGQRDSAYRAMVVDMILDIKE